MTEEMGKELKRLRLERTQLRRIFSAEASKFGNLFDSHQIDPVTVQSDFLKLDDKAQRLFKIDGVIYNILFESNLSEEEISDEVDRTEEYRDLYLSLVAKKNQLERISIQPVDYNIDPQFDQLSLKSHKSVSESSKHNLMLPKLVPKKFDGNLKEWISFWTIFKRIHESDDFDAETKFQYLLIYTTEGSPARQLVESFPPSAGNYEKAVDQLKQRFGREELLVELYSREILKLVLLQAKGKDSLPLVTLYDRLETQIRALETLGMTSDKFSYLLTPLVESALPDSLLKDWERHSFAIQPSLRDNSDHASGEVDKLRRLLNFIKLEVESEERLSLARGAFAPIVCESSSPTRQSNLNGNFEIKKKEKVSTATDLVNLRSARGSCCIFCTDDVSHATADCFKARTISLVEIHSLLKENNCCFLCTRKGHSKTKCRVILKCIICDGRHVPLLCPNRKLPEEKAPLNDESLTEHNLTNSSTELVIMQTVLVRFNGFPQVTARVLFDSGSSRSYISKRLATKLNYKPNGSIKLEHALFGGLVSEAKMHDCYKVHLVSMDNKYACNFDVLDTEEICQAAPTVPISHLAPHLKRHNITLTDREGGQIDVLIGADIAGKLITGKKINMSNGIVAFETLLGWTLMGKVPQPSSKFMTNINLFSLDKSAQELWKLETLGIEDPATVQTRDQKAAAAKKYFLDTVQILEDGRYQVRLPWREDHPPLQRNFSLALKRWESTARKLNTHASHLAYMDVFSDWLSSGIIEEVPISEWDLGHYLPHRPVFKEHSTTPVRPVFDASAKERGHPSLNQCLETGPNLIELIPSVLLRFREGKIGLIADIKKAFLQISIHPCDRNFVRFLWKNPDGDLKIFRHARVPFGVCSSPFLLGAVLEHHLDKCLNLVSEGLLPVDKSFIHQLKRCLYVDNYVGSVDNINDLHAVINQAKDIFKLACFDLRGWMYSDTELGDHTNISVLGLIWDCKTDVLKINVPTFDNILNSETISRRMLLSAAQSLYDPIGIICPVTVIPKKLVQDTWLSGGDWDSPVADPIKKKFLLWICQLPSLKQASISRWLTNFNSVGAIRNLHTFCDASKIAYAAVVFLTIQLGDQIHVHLVAAKSRVAPVKITTIPRLELLAATVGARLCRSVQKVLEGINLTYYWSDSSTALTWIKRNEPWAIFVGNRVSEIRELSDPKYWRHIPGPLNPADMASRGCLPDDFIKSTWWEGPEWLSLPESQWPSTKIEVDEDEVSLEKRKTVVTALDNVMKPFSAQLLGDTMSSYWKIIKVVGWIIRFWTNSRHDLETTKGPLTLDELNLAEKWILRLVQRESFEGPHDSSLRKLKPHEEEGILRVRTKIWARKDTPDFRAPIILPSQHIIVERLIDHVHRQNCHIVGQALLNNLREHYWIIRGRQTIRRVIKKCVVCLRYTSKHLDMESPPLPLDRVRDARVFEVTGTDFTGPLYLADGSKVWICIFTCAIYRAVHLDIASSLSTEAFMLVFRRFVARRGRPSIIYSDNGTNYRGLTNALKAIDWEKISEHSKAERVEWRFNPPTASWWGGFWERMIQTLKVVLRKILGRSALNCEELYSIVCDCESLINSRPITYCSEDIDDLVPITPSMFLQETMEVGVPDCDQLNSTSLSRRVKYRQKKTEELRQRFRLEYLGTLTFPAQGTHSTRAPRIGEVVMIGCDNKKRLGWPLAVIENVIYGKDGNVRLVEVRTVEGKVSRPIQRIYPLEIDCKVPFTQSDQTADDSNEESLPSEEDTFNVKTSSSDIDHQGTTSNDQAVEYMGNAKTKCGRTVKIPIRYL